MLVYGDLVTSSHPEGSVQLSVWRRLRWSRLAATCAAMLLLALMARPLGVGLGVLALTDLAVGWWRSGPLVRQTFMSTLEDDRGLNRVEGVGE
jgi:hypothetical protein